MPQYYPKFTFIGNRVGFNYGEGFGNISKLKKYGTGGCGNQNWFSWAWMMKLMNYQMKLIYFLF